MSLDGWKEKLFRHYMTWSCRPARIRGYLHRVLPPSRTPYPAERRCIRAAALQLELHLVKNPLHYVDLMHRRLREAVEEGAQLIAFPEYNNLALLGLLPGIEKMEEAYSNKGKQEAEPVKQDKEAEGSEEKSPAEGISLVEVFRYMSPAVEPLVKTLFSSLAVAYGVHIMAGSYVITCGEATVNRSYLFGPDGELIGSQDKVHLLPLEARWGLKRGSAFSIFDTPVGRLAAPVCMDATYFETFRILENKGTDIVLLPVANLESYNYWLALRGIWLRVQESPLYGIKSTLVGTIAGMTFTGRAGIFAPLEITPRRDGVLAEVETFEREGMAVADLDLEALQALRSNHSWRDSNRALYERYLSENSYATSMKEHNLSIRDI
ncbi:MAG: nitrilase-related carbon-nitrogen hydrolase [Bacillota bacterium]|nr:nitrilase-related carbon-nitrogen hydrolase [Bacillota bacterium]